MNTVPQPYRQVVCKEIESRHKKSICWKHQQSSITILHVSSSCHHASSCQNANLMTNCSSRLGICPNRSELTRQCIVPLTPTFPQHSLLYGLPRPIRRVEKRSMHLSELSGSHRFPVIHLVAWRGGVRCDALCYPHPLRQRLCCHRLEHIRVVDAVNNSL